MSGLFRNHTLSYGILAFLLGGAFGWLIFIYITVGEETFSAYQNQGRMLFLASGAMASLVNYLLARKLNQWIPWRERTSLRMTSGIIASLAILSIFFVGALPKLLLLEVAIVYKIAILLVVSAVIFNVLYFAVYSFYQFSKAQVQYAENQRQQLSLQLEALRSQLSPHFLFNCLNTISALLYKDLAKTEKFIRQLAKTYQYTINAKDEIAIPLSRELEFVHAYQFLLSVRFEDQVDVKIDLDKTDLRSMIPPMTVQLLVENAVKHNTISKSEKLQIEVFRKQGWLIVRNNKTQKPAKTPSFKIGLENIKARYQLLQSRLIKVVDETNDFQVWLPMIRL